MHSFILCFASIFNKRAQCLTMLPGQENHLNSSKHNSIVPDCRYYGWTLLCFQNKEIRKTILSTAWLHLSRPHQWKPVQIEHQKMDKIFTKFHDLDSRHPISNYPSKPWNRPLKQKNQSGSLIKWSKVTFNETFIFIVALMLENIRSDERDQWRGSH